jgi:TetR/AcrR family transcriptional regulator, regulator of autoinduction and epiphytic fitness
MSTSAKAPRKKRFVERPDIRATLLDAAEALIREEGYAAATARRIASKVGLKHQVVFYYFGTQDELLLALVQRTSQAHQEKLERTLQSDQPLRALWDLLRDRDATKFHLELMALANHNETIRSHLASQAVISRNIEAAAIERHLKARGIEPRLSPRLVSILTNAIARLLIQEMTLSIDAGHEEVEAMVEDSLRIFETSGDVAAPPNSQQQ